MAKTIKFTPKKTNADGTKKPTITFTKKPIWRKTKGSRIALKKKSNA